jgi:(p)ppGpp synthase/HD superfamily hydrolase
MSLDEDVFKVAELEAANKYLNKTKEWKKRFTFLNSIQVADRYHAIQETETLVRTMKKENKSYFLREEYTNLYENVGPDATKEYLESQNKFNPLNLFNLRIRTAKQFLKELEKKETNYDK